MAYGTSNRKNGKNKENLDRHLKVDDPLTSHLKPVKIGDEVSGLLLGGKDVQFENDLTVLGDIEIEGSSTSGLSTINVYKQTAVSSARNALEINFEDGSTYAHTARGLKINYDLVTSTAGGSTAYGVGAGINVSSSGGASGSAYVNMTGIIVDVNGSTDGIETATGISIDADGADTNTGLKINTAGTHIHLEANADTDDYATLAVADTGDLTITTVGDGTTDSDLTLDVDGSLILDPANGNFIAKKAGTEFSAANSAYAGMILGYTCIGLDEAPATYNLTTGYVVPTDELQVTFVAPPSGKVEIEIQIGWDAGSSNVGDCFAGLSSANATSGYSALADFHEVELFDAMSRGALRVIRHSWTLTGLTAGTSYQYWAGFKTSATLGTPHLHCGGNATGEYPDFIMKATALPNTIST